MRDRQAYQEAYNMRWKAEELAGVQYPAKARGGLLSVPVEWTAALLMDKAGVPLSLIAYVSCEEEKRLRRQLIVAKALLMFPPYAARIETLMEKMPIWAAAPGLDTTPAKEGACAEQGR
jgi:hypothetical protein